MRVLSKAVATASVLFWLALAPAHATPQVMIYGGQGAFANDLTDIKALLNQLGITWIGKGSVALNSMTRADLKAYKLIIWPGGWSPTMENSLTDATIQNIHDAVVLDGVNYLGFCAGSFIAETSTEYRTLHLATNWFQTYYDKWEGILVNVMFPQAPTEPLVYWDGPEIRGVPYIMAKYPDGSGAVGEGMIGAGWVVLSGLHPEAQAGGTNWNVTDYSPDVQAANNAYAKTLIGAALNRTMLPHY